MLLEFDILVPENVFRVDPIGYLELLELMAASKGVLTDSGTIVEEAAVLGVPSVQMRTSTERPQVYECGASVKFNPFGAQDYNLILQKLNKLFDQGWKHPFGDGKASYRIVDDLLKRYEGGSFGGHQPSKYLPFSKKSFMSEN
jgi:UDP-N-acetylglucosamine 2-epimerase (non-hydrolysing)